MNSRKLFFVVYCLIISSSMYAMDKKSEPKSGVPSKSSGGDSGKRPRSLLAEFNDADSRTKKKPCKDDIRTKSEEPEKENDKSILSKEEYPSTGGFPFHISPIKTVQSGGLGYHVRHHCVYAWMATKDNKPNIPHEDRIDFQEILDKERGIKKALAYVEAKFRSYLDNDRTLLPLTMYVGLAVNATHRVGGHNADLKTLADLIDEEDSDFSQTIWKGNRKLDFAKIYAEAGYEKIIMRPLVYNIPEKHLADVEVLLGILFGANFKGNTVLGNLDAWKFITERYLKSKDREKALKPLDEKVRTITEDYEQKVLKCITAPAA